jgi:hypothetical protein
VIEKDRALLNRLATLNIAMGEVVLRMVSRQDGGELDVVDLRMVGSELSQLGQDMLTRAAELDGPRPVIVQSPPAAIEDSR